MSAQQFEPLDLNEFAEICHNAYIAFCLDKFPSSERALEHFYIEHLNARAAAQAAQPEAVGGFEVAYQKALFKSEPGTIKDIARLCFEAGLASAPTPEPMSAPTAEPVATDPEDCRAWCPRCEGTGDEVQMSGSSPDAHEVTVNCRHCDGNGTLYAAYTGVVRELAKKHQAYIKACGEIYFSKLATPPSAATPEPSDAERWRMASTSRNFGITNWTQFGQSTVYDKAASDLIDAAIRATKGGKL